jgi:hypothetical protein
MSSEDIIRQIIKSVVADASAILKSRHGALLPDNLNINGIFASPVKPKNENYHISETLAAFMIRACVLDPSNHFDLEKKQSREDIARLVNLCVSRITSENDPCMETIRIQVYFDTHFPAQCQLLLI